MRPFTVLGFAFLLLVFPAAATAQLPEYVLQLPDIADISGAVVDVPVTFDNAGVDIGAWSVGVCHDVMLVDNIGVTQGATTLTINNGGPPDFYTENVFPDGWVSTAVVNFLGAYVVPPGTGYELNVATYLLTGPDGTATEIVFCDSLGNPPVTTLLADNNMNNYVPTQIGSQVVIGGGPPPPDPDLFLRGDADGSGSVSGIVDATFILFYQFVAGSPEPPCLDAADVDDNGAVQGIVDGVYLLNAFFVPGSPPVPLPGIIDCGEDPTDDTVDCAMVSCP